MSKIAHILWVPIFVTCSAYSLPAQGQSLTDPAATHKIPPFKVPEVKPGVAYERFLVIGDMGTGREDQATVATAMVRRAKANGLDFWLSTGDNFYPSGVEAVDDPQWKTKFEEVYADPSLQVPIYATLGNHDHRGNVQAQVDYAKRNKNWKMAGLYYTFTRTLTDGTTVQFFAINTQPLHTSLGGDEKQIAWLDEKLRKSQARWKIVFGHHTLYGHNPRRGHDKTLIANLEPLFVSHKADIYFAGHDHTLEMIKPVKGVHYVISGAGAGPDWAYPVTWTDESHYVATLGGFVLCRVSRDELVIEFVRLNGKTQYAHVLTK